MATTGGYTLEEFNVLSKEIYGALQVALQSLEASSKADKTKTGPSTPASRMVQSSDHGKLKHGNTLEMQKEGVGDKGRANRAKNPQSAPKRQTLDKSYDKMKHESFCETVKKEVGGKDVDNNGKRFEGMSIYNHDIDAEQPIAKNPTNDHRHLPCTPATISKAVDSDRLYKRTLQTTLLRSLKKLHVPSLGDQNLTERDLEMIFDQILYDKDSSSASPSEGELSQTFEISGTTSGPETNEERDVDTGHKHWTH